MTINGQFLVLLSLLNITMPAYSMGCFTCCENQKPKKPRLIENIYIREWRDSEKLAKRKLKKAYNTNCGLINEELHATLNLNQDLTKIIAAYVAQKPQILVIDTDDSSDED